LTELLFSEICNKKNTYLSIVERESSIFSLVAKRIYIFFTRFRNTNRNNRYVFSRYHLIRLTKKIGIYNKFNYCFSHSGRNSAVLFSSQLDHMSVDIERVGRRLPESLRLKVRSLYSDAKLSELMVVMILESLVKLSIFNPPLSLSKLISDINPVTIKALNDNAFEINVDSLKVYSTIYTFADLHICITLESDQFKLSL